MTVSLRLPDDIASRLQNLAQLTGRSKTFYMIEAIREHLDDPRSIGEALKGSRLGEFWKHWTSPLVAVINLFQLCDRHPELLNDLRTGPRVVAARFTVTPSGGQI